MQSELPEALLDAATQRRLLPFIGAGFSKNVSPEVPGWEEIVPIAADLLRCDKDVLRAQGDVQQIAEYVNRRGHMEDLCDRLIDSVKKHAVATSGPHKLLPQLAMDWLFTTNWDNYIERGFEEAAISYSKIVTADHFVKPISWVPSNGAPRAQSDHPVTKIVKYHGDLQFAGSLVFSESTYYERLDFEHPLDIKLRSEMMDHTVLFVGYSFRDPNVRYLWHKYQKFIDGTAKDQPTRAFFVTPSSNPVADSLLKARGIEVVRLAPTDISGQIARLLEALISAQGGR